MRHRQILSLVLLGSMFLPRLAEACPFCSAVAQTFTEEISTSDVAVIARLLKAPEAPKAVDAETELPRATFAVVDVLRGGILDGPDRYDRRCLGPLDGVVPESRSRQGPDVLRDEVVDVLAIEFGAQRQLVELRVSRPRAATDAFRAAPGYGGD